MASFPAFTIDNQFTSAVANMLSGNSIGLNSQRQYQVIHCALDEAGAASSTPIFLASSGMPITTHIANSNTIKLTSTMPPLMIGPGISVLTAQTGVTPSNGVTFNLIPQPNLYGRF